MSICLNQPIDKEKSSLQTKTKENSRTPIGLGVSKLWAFQSNDNQESLHFNISILFVTKKTCNLR